MAIGKHLLVECHGEITRHKEESLGKLLQEAAVAGGASVIYSHFHPFTGGGVTGVVLLKESHITIHTWPEQNYAALDIFMCGECDVNAALKFIENSESDSVFFSKSYIRTNIK